MESGGWSARSSSRSNRQLDVGCMTLPAPLNGVYPLVRGSSANKKRGRMLGAAPCVSVVDDDDLVLKSLERVLRSGGYNVRTFPSSHDYLAQRPAGPGCV